MFSNVHFLGAVHSTSSKTSKQKTSTLNTNKEKPTEQEKQKQEVELIQNHISSWDSLIETVNRGNVSQEAQIKALKNLQEVQMKSSVLKDFFDFKEELEEFNEATGQNIELPETTQTRRVNFTI